YLLWPDVRLLLVSQAVSIAFGAALVGLLAAKHGLGKASLAVEAGFAFSYGVMSAIVRDFHEVGFGLPLLIGALWALLDGRLGRLAAFSACLLLVKEDMPLYIAGFGLVLFAVGRRLAGVLFAAAAAVAEILLLYVVIPAFSYSGRYTYIGGGARGIRSPADAVAELAGHLASWQGLAFLFLIAATAGVGLTSKLLWALAPPAASRFLSHDPVYLGFHYHYGVLLTAVCFAAMIDALSRRAEAGLAEAGLAAGAGMTTPPGGEADAAGRKARFGRLRGVQAVLLAVGALGGVAGSDSLSRTADFFGAGAVLAEQRSVAAAIPDGAAVVADVYLLDHIIDRTDVTVAFPLRLDAGGQPLWQDETGIPLEGDFVFLDLETRGYDNRTAPWAASLAAWLEESGDYQVVDRSGRFLLFGRV
ncbi:MAG: DUF2079 domain-containing protein, partial [Propionibacteriaceae bacterium]|nr:DUF2079 domain-containing protein [Propionibacteriaceae bacterium]